MTVARTKQSEAAVRCSSAMSGGPWTIKRADLSHGMLVAGGDFLSMLG